MREAEGNKFTVRRVELIGNTYTADYVIRQKILLNEGDLFTRARLRKSLENISKLKQFMPVQLKDIQIHLDRGQKLVDINIYLSERTRRRVSSSSTKSTWKGEPMRLTEMVSCSG